MLASPVSAQNQYVGAALVGDIARFSRADLDDDRRLFPTVPREASLDGEALGLGVSAGTAIGERWGIEIEVVRPARIERSIRQTFPFTFPAPGLFPLPGPLPTFEFELQGSQRHTTITAAGWLRQDLGDRFEISYLAGITFSRMELEHTVSIPLLRSLIPIPLPSIDAIEHGVGPAIGIQAQWKVTDRVAIVPGMRLHGVALSGTSGWLLRPAIGARWLF